MNKKAYIAPAITVVNVECNQMLANSTLSADGGTNAEITVGGNLTESSRATKAKAGTAATGANKLPS